MQIVRGNRQSGKSSYLIRKAERNGALIIVANQRRKDCLEQMARDQGHYADVMTIDRFLDKRSLQLSRKVMIDDLASVLFMLFKGNEILEITTSEEVLFLDPNRRMMFYKLKKKISVLLKRARSKLTSKK